MKLEVYLQGIKTKFLVLLLVFQGLGTIRGLAGMPVISLLSEFGYNSQVMMSKAELVSDPFVGRFIGQIIGQQIVIEIRKSTNDNYEIYVNGLGPDIAVLRNDVISGTSDGLAFSISLSGRNIILTMFDQPSLFVRDETIVNSNAATPNYRPQAIGFRFLKKP